MTNRLRSFLLAAAAIFGLGAFAIGPVHASSIPPASDFIATAKDGTITITNNSTWHGISGGSASIVDDQRCAELARRKRRSREFSAAGDP